MQNKYFKFFIIILAVAVIVPQVAMAAWWNPFTWGWLNRIFHFQQVQQKQEQQADFSKLNKDELLHKLFPKLTFKNGAADLSQSQFFNGTRLYLKQTAEDNFINKNENNLLLMVRLDGVAHAGGLYHAYLGVFDKNGNLLTPASNFPNESLRGDLYQDKPHFGSDGGQFEFYDCNGIKYILFVASGCPNGSCCSDFATLYGVKNGVFEKVQTLDYNALVGLNNSGFAFKMILSGNKMLVNKVPSISDERDCERTPFKEFSWDNKTCRFVLSKTSDQTAAKQSQPSNTNTQRNNVKNCGVNDLLSKDISINELNFKNDPALVCIGQSIANCSPAKITLKSKKDETLIETSGVNFSNCRIKTTIIKDLLTSSNLNKYIECPINKIKYLGSGEITSDLAKDPGNTAFGILTSLGFYFLDPKKAVDELGCTTNFK